MLVVAALACGCQPEKPEPPDKEAAIKLTLDGPRLEAAFLSPGERRTYAVDVPAGSSIYLYMIPETGLNLSVVVRDEAGFRVQSGNPSYSENNRYNLVTFASRLGGNYYVTLSAGGGAGRYHLEAKGGCGGGKLERLQVLRRGGPTFQGELGGYPDFADYLVETDDQKMIFTVDPDYGLNPVVYIYSLDCRMLLTLDNKYAGRRDNTRMAAFEPKFPGKYVVRVVTSGGGGGKFTINVR